MSEFTDAQVIAAISKALAASDMKAVVGLLHVLAIQNSREAAILVNTIELLSDTPMNPALAEDGA